MILHCVLSLLWTNWYIYSVTCSILVLCNLFFSSIFTIYLIYHIQYYSHAIKHIFHHINMPPPFPDIIVLSSCFISFLPDRETIDGKSAKLACNMCLLLIERMQKLQITIFHKRLQRRMQLCLLYLSPSMELHLVILNSLKGN